jgi:hypothetical protein
MTPFDRLVSCFVEPAARTPPSSPPPNAARPASAVVVGSGDRAVLPIAAAAAGELRVRAAATSAVVAVWAPEPPPRLPSGAATPAARRLAASLAADGGTASACGRLAWLALPADADDAAGAVRRLDERAGAPLVLGICGARPAALEPVLAERDAAIAVLAADADPDLRELALAGLPGPARVVHSPLPPGPPRWAALAGLARLRALPSLGG